ncbi:MAG TPA: hypothetical protein EYP53_06670 [Candidatus Latescibacteria bacterium]|nr:hypothetical protein [Candidatus Latescibacterota bacterium]
MSCANSCSAKIGLILVFLALVSDFLCSKPVGAEMSDSPPRIAFPVAYSLEGQTYSDSITSDPWLGKDKFLHLYASTCLVGLGFYTFHYGLEEEKGESRLFAVLGTAVIGLLKEEHDRRSPESLFSFKDLIADFIGIAVGVALFTF